MIKRDEIEKAVAALSPKELKKFRAWFAAFEAERAASPAAPEPESGAGRLKSIAGEAIAGFKSGRTRNI